MPGDLVARARRQRVVVGRFWDWFLYEGETRTPVLPEVGSENLAVRLQAYRYVAVAHRYPPSYPVISGTGCILQSGARSAAGPGF